MSGVAASDISAASKGDRQSMNRLIEENTALIWSIARRFFGRGVEADDLFQLGSIGFIKAVYGYDPGFGTQFSTYAVPKIMGEIKRYLRDDGMIKVSRTVKENAAKVYQARDMWEKQHGCEARISDLCYMTGLSEEDVALSLQASTSAESLDAESSDGFSLLSLVSDGQGEDVLVDGIAVGCAVRRLDTSLRDVIMLRYYHNLTQQRAAKILRISQVQVSRLEKKALARLREMLDG